MVRLLLLAAIFLVGCGPSPGYLYEVHVDPGANYQSVFSAAKAWKVATKDFAEGTHLPTAEFNLTQTYWDCNGTPFCIYVEAEVPDGETSFGYGSCEAAGTGGCTTTDSNQSSRIKVEASLSLETKRRVYAHELGHALGLQHLPYKALMEHDSPVPDPTYYDVAYFYDVRQ